MLNEYTLIAFALSLLVIGWLLAKYEPMVVTIVSRLALAVMAISFCVLVVTGLQHEAWGVLHRWSGFQTTLLVWAWSSFSLGAAWHQHWPSVWALLGRTGLLLASAGLVFLAGVSAYLGPTNNPGADQESYNRFVVMHQIVVPLFLCSCIGLFGWWEGRKGK